MLFFFAGNRLNEIYYIGIIDILQTYNNIKKIETTVKGLTYDKVAGFPFPLDQTPNSLQMTISSIPPRDYATRFVDFVRGHLEGKPAEDDERDLIVKQKSPRESSKTKRKSKSRSEKSKSKRTK